MTAVVGLCTAVLAAPSGLAKTPPMGWMSWQVFRCVTDCKSDPENCIGETLYKSHVDAMVAGGYVTFGYDSIHIDDCWEGKQPPRDSSGKLYANATRFPSGFGGPNGLATYTHSKGMKFGIYSDEGTKTCGGYPGSKGYEKIDAETFAEWGVDYLKLDGCNNAPEDYPQGYAAMGTALQNSGRDIVFSCSWAAYLGDNETAKPFREMTNAGCNLVRLPSAPSSVPQTRLMCIWTHRAHGRLCGACAHAWTSSSGATGTTFSARGNLRRRSSTTGPTTAPT